MVRQENLVRRGVVGWTYGGPVVQNKGENGSSIQEDKWYQKSEYFVSNKTRKENTLCIIEGNSQNSFWAFQKDTFGSVEVGRNGIFRRVQ